jgi:hypothetical protein
MKTCRKCGEEKPLAQFSKTAAHADGLRHWCKVCDNNYTRAYNKTHIDQSKAWRKANAERILEVRRSNPNYSINSVLSRYKLSRAEYDALMAKGCYICGTFNSLCIDHDHKCCAKQSTCGKCIRGVLCSQHNKALGGFDDDVDALRMAIAYLLDTTLPV